jgi:hypothetical protein
MVKEMPEIVLFSDDTSLLFDEELDSSDANASEMFINSSFDRVFNWFSANNPVLNPKKTKCI